MNIKYPNQILFLLYLNQLFYYHLIFSKYLIKQESALDEINILKIKHKVPFIAKY